MRLNYDYLRCRGSTLLDPLSLVLLLGSSTVSCLTADIIAAYSLTTAQEEMELISAGGELDPLDPEFIIR
jgi:hypothetical protein